MNHSIAFRQSLSKLRRGFFEALGSKRFSRLALNDLDIKLEKYLGFPRGFFIELGANDGLDQSNTYYFERWYDWQGILTEAIPELYQRAVHNRPKARVFHCACVAFDYPEPYVQMSFANLMSVVKGSWRDSKLEARHVAAGSPSRSYDIQVPARTLTSILDECQVSQIDLLSLDVEGYEKNVLRGLDFTRYAPNYILVEARQKAEIAEILLERYECVEQMTKHDFLYRLKSGV